SQRGYAFLRQFSVLLAGWFAAAGILLSLTFFLKVSENYSRIWFSTMLVAGGGLSLLLRVVVFLLLRRLRASGMNLITVLLVDSGCSSASQLSNGKALDEYGFKVIHNLPFKLDEDWLSNLVAKVD